MHSEVNKSGAQEERHSGTLGQCIHSELKKVFSLNLADALGQSL